MKKCVYRNKKRDNEQPTKDVTAGSTFRNPCGFSSSGQGMKIISSKLGK